MQRALSDRDNIYLNLHMLRKAMWAVKKTMGIDTDYSKAISRAKTYNNLRMFKKAINTYEQAIFMQPENAEAYYHLGNTFSRLGMYNEAVNSYKQAIGNKSKYVEAMYKLSIACSKLGRIKEAIDITKRTIQMMPNMSAAHKNLGLLYGKSGSYEEAIGPLSKALEIEHNNTEARYTLIQYYLKLNDKNAAKREFMILQEHSPHTASKLSHEISA